MIGDMMAFFGYQSVIRQARNQPAEFEPLHIRKFIGEYPLDNIEVSQVGKRLIIIAEQIAFDVLGHKYYKAYNLAADDVVSNVGYDGNYLSFTLGVCKNNKDINKTLDIEDLRDGEDDGNSSNS